MSDPERIRRLTDYEKEDLSSHLPDHKSEGEPHNDSDSADDMMHDDASGGYNRGRGGRLRPKRGDAAYPGFHLLMGNDAGKQQVNSVLTDEERLQFACSMASTPPLKVQRQWRTAGFKTTRQALKERELKCDDFLANFTSLSEELPSVNDVMSSPIAEFITVAARDSGYSGSTKDLLLTEVHPLFLQARTSASKADNPRWDQAMRSDYASEWFKAAQIEIETLEKMKCWDVVDRTPDMKVLGGTWAFKLKRFPDGLAKKFKARFCARGDQQTQGVDVFET